jgi:O-6-methylguanine DNA methyltransferase
MIKQSILGRLTINGEGGFVHYSSPVGSVYILGDDTSLKAIILSPSQQIIKTLSSYYKQSPTGPVQYTVDFLDSYFSALNARRARFPELKVLHSTSTDSNISISINRHHIRLDCSLFTPLEIKVYHALLRTPVGSTISYASLAVLSGVPRASRFVGSTMAKNAFPILIPCHRVIKSDGSIGNYTGGTSIKCYLLNHEKHQ